MPVTTKPAPHSASAWGTFQYGRIDPAAKPDDLLRESCHKEHEKMKSGGFGIIASSFTNSMENSADEPLFASSNGFVKGAIQAYNEHHHLVVRPEDVWFSILTQLTLYINEHAEELRGKFVAHEGKKTLMVVFDRGSVTTVDYGDFADRMSHLIHENVVDPDLRTWVVPNFTTTTKSDEVVASCILMGAMQKYFNYRCCIACGLPSVTLLGERSDWEKINTRLEKLLSFGEEPTQWYELLKPVIARFVTTFDAPDSKETKDFWQKIAHYSDGGSGPTYLSGWITAFCFWNDAGKPYFIPKNKPPTKGNWTGGMGWPTPILTLDGVRYHRVESHEVPSGYTSFPVTIDDNGTEYKSRMVAGSVAIRVTSSGGQVTEEPGKPLGESEGIKEITNLNRSPGTGLDTVQPESGWWIFEVEEEEKEGEKKA